MHSESAEHAVGHVASVPSQTNGEQDGVPLEPRRSVSHVPLDAHASHAPPQALLQQTPSAQKPD